jgi:hypothetical protein
MERVVSTLSHQFGGSVDWIAPTRHLDTRGDFLRRNGKLERRNSVVPIVSASKTVSRQDHLHFEEPKLTSRDPKSPEMDLGDSLLHQMQTCSFLL